MTGPGALPAEISAVNIGLPLFAEALDRPGHAGDLGRLAPAGRR